MQMIGSRDPVDDIDEQMTEEEYDEIMKGTRESENNKKLIKRKILSSAAYKGEIQ